MRFENSTGAEFATAVGEQFDSTAFRVVVGDAPSTVRSR